MIFYNALTPQRNFLQSWPWLSNQAEGGVEAGNLWPQPASMLPMPGAAQSLIAPMPFEGGANPFGGRFGKGTVPPWYQQPAQPPGAVMAGPRQFDGNGSMQGQSMMDGMAQPGMAGMDSMGAQRRGQPQYRLR